MSLEYVSANGSRAMRVARKIVKPLDWGDIESVITQSMSQDEFNALFMSVDSDYENNEKRIHELLDDIRDISSTDAYKLIKKYDNLRCNQECIKLVAWFQLGFAAALRLLDKPADLKIIGGGHTPKLRGNCNL
jgi:hypothetical protein